MKSPNLKSETKHEDSLKDIVGGTYKIATDRKEQELGIDFVINLEEYKFF